DGPTAPTSFAHVVGGRSWVAVALPDGLPDAQAWSGFVPRGSGALPRLQALKQAEAEARKTGRLERAQELAEARMRAAAQAAGAAVPAEALARASAALGSWDERVGLRLAAGAYPALDSARWQVDRLRALADAHAAAGENAAAAEELAEAAVRARAFSPEAVGTRVIADAEARIAAAAHDSGGLRRARDLLRTAREAVATGDYARAVRRATYAVEIVDAELPRPR
ncbi:MAG TPA: hypothetical protein VFH27_16910, partial [Longimicrobiaceae bacterium]|nr:hypothetical protein [Longimicrobiaceae bacterium]